MPDFISLDDKNKIISIKSVGMVTDYDIKSSLTTIRIINKDKGYHRVLVDTTKQESMPSVKDIYSIFSNLPENFKFALFSEIQQATEAEVEYSESVAQKKGLSVKKFLCRDDAMKWLKH